jgi:ParB family chromosome partitioning protein
LEALRNAELTERHARALLKLPGEDKKLWAIREISRQNMSVARTEQYIDSLLQQGQSTAVKANVGAFLTYLNQSLARIQRSGISAISERKETEDQIVLTIIIPKSG